IADVGCQSRVPEPVIFSVHDVVCNAICRAERQTVFPTAGNSYATLVLECRSGHFSTDAFNSVLIAQPILRATRLPKTAIQLTAIRTIKIRRGTRRQNKSKQRGNHMSRRK